MQCEQCGIEFESKRTDAKYCSPKCRVTANRKGANVTDNVTLSEPAVTDNFKFYTISKANGMGRTHDEKSGIRTAKYWYDVPLGAVPVYQKSWPKIPEFMNGRQYFLWWKNNFENKDDIPVILNPLKTTSSKT